MKRVDPSLLVKIWCLFSLTHTMMTDDQLTTSSWLLSASQEVSSYEMAVSGRSKVECIRDCRKYSYCSSFAFNPCSRTCYLLPSLENDTHGQYLGKVYVDKDPRCTFNHVPTTNGDVIWSHTLTSLKGEVACYADFINSISDVIVQCLADGSWETKGECLLHVWRNPALTEFPITVPLPVVDGWSICLDGIPTAAVRFTIDLITGSNDLALQADFRFQFSSDSDVTVLTYRLGGVFFGAEYISPFPFTVGQPFRLRITATAAHEFKVYVDDTIYATYLQSASLPATSVTAVHVRNDVTVTKFDIWCT